VANPGVEPFFILDDKGEVKFWEYTEGLHKHSVQSLRMVTETLVWHMSGAFEVGYVHLGTLFSSTPLPFPLGSDSSLDCGQELKERSHRKSLFIHHGSGVWAALPHQRALVEVAKKRLSKKSAEADELRVITTTLKEEAVQARDAAAEACEDAAKAREEVAKAREDLAPLLARVKEFEEDVALVSGQRDALNVQIRLASARISTLTEEVKVLKGTV
jgi:hypothetical protein